MAAKKTASKKAAKKKAAKKKASAKAAKTAAKATKKAAKKAPRKAAAKAAAKPAAEAPKEAAPAKGGVSAAEINLGHVFALRPPVAKAFRQDHFRVAKIRLKEERYESVEEAARAVAAKALEMTNDGPVQRGGTRRKRH